jgi:hypothetical protein
MPQVCLANSSDDEVEVEGVVTNSMAQRRAHAAATQPRSARSTPLNPTHAPSTTAAGSSRQHADGEDAAHMQGELRQGMCGLQLEPTIDNTYQAKHGALLAARTKGVQFAHWVLKHVMCKPAAMFAVAYSQKQPVHELMTDIICKLYWLSAYGLALSTRLRHVADVFMNAHYLACGLQWLLQLYVLRWR